VGVEPFHVLQIKDLPLESIALSDENLNFRTPIAHVLAHAEKLSSPRQHISKHTRNQRNYKSQKNAVPNDIENLMSL